MHAEHLVNEANEANEVMDSFANQSVAILAQARVKQYLYSRDGYAQVLL